ncbi:MAG: EamA family transporter RarD [Candidatus Puniceispirillaceae bacterium]
MPDRFGYMAAFLGPALWGLLPVFYVLLDGYSAVEIVVQRSLWAFLLMFIFYAVYGKITQTALLFTYPRQLFWMIVGTAMIAVNWTTFVYAVGEVRVVEASFGYFIYPLFAVAASVLFLGERLDRRGIIALVLSAIGVVIKAWSLGFVPDISLILAVSFALYAVVRKQIRISSLQGFFCETILLMPIVIAFLGYHLWHGGHLFFDGKLTGFLLAVACGVITTVPLVLFLRGNKALPLSIAAFIFYVNPSLQLLCGVLFFEEAFSTKDLLAFGCIWAGLIIQFARKSPISA